MNKALIITACLLVLPILTIADSCIDNTTSQSNFTWNGEIQAFETICDNGCDSVTGQCAPTTYEANIGNIILIIIVIVSIAAIYKYAKR